jgi:translation initiation factor 1
MSPDRGKVVYSTDPGFADRCPRCGRRPCRCPRPQSLPPEKQTVHIWRDRKGRAGKTVTVVRDLQLAPSDMAALAKRLKSVCGTGGSVKDGNIEIQGDHRDRVAAALQALGYHTRLAGG